MLNKILPALYKRLRRRSGLSRQQFATRVKVSANTLKNYESGQTRPDAKTEARMVAASHCSDLEIVELLCELLSEELETRVGIVAGEHGYRPATALAGAQATLCQLGGDLPEPERRALGNKMHTAQLMQLACERHNADLVEYTADCRAKARRRRRSADPFTDEPLNQGATGPTAKGSTQGGDGPVFHNAAARGLAPEGGLAEPGGNHRNEG